MIGRGEGGHKGGERFLKERLRRLLLNFTDTPVFDPVMCS